MPPAALALLLYAGVAGSDASDVDFQLSTLLRKEAHATPVAVSDGERRVLARQQPGAAALVQRWHTDGVVVGEVERSEHGARLRLVVYDGRGRRKELLEIGLDGNSLDEDGIATIRGSVLPDLAALARGGVGAPAPEQPEPPAQPEPDLPAAGSATVTHETPLQPPLRLRAAAGIGVLTRSFSAGPPSIIGYSSAPVASFRLAAEVDPMPTIGLRAEVERTLGMSTRIAGAQSPTSVQRWQMSAAWGTRIAPAVVLLPGVGVGRRTFTVDSKETERSPDSDYTYLVLAGAAAWRTSGFEVSAWLAVEPAVGGAQPTETAFGAARRVGADLRLTIDVPLTSHLFVRGEGYLQRFWWWFSDAGDRGAGGAGDSYACATIQLGASY